MRGHNAHEVDTSSSRDVHSPRTLEGSGAPSFQAFTASLISTTVSKAICMALLLSDLPAVQRPQHAAVSASPLRE